MGEPALKRPSGFQPGVSGNPAGKPKGIQNRVTKDAQRIAQKLVTDHKYQAALLKQLRERDLHPQLENMLWNYAWGKPRETIEYRGDPLVLQQLLVEVIQANEARNGNGSADVIDVEEVKANGNGDGEH